MDKFNDDDEDSLMVVQYYKDALIVFEGINTLFHDNWILDCTYVFQKGIFWWVSRRKVCHCAYWLYVNCDVMVIEMVKIKMFDVMAYTLGDVAYVSKMCRNLISLSQLDSKGYNYSLVSGVLKVPYGSTILMEREKYDGLYYLIR